MRLEHYPKEKLAEEVKQIVGKYLHHKGYSVFFFGSRVAGKGSERSDIDVGIEGSQPVPIGILAQIKEEIEKLPTLYKIDVVDFASVDETFRDVAKEHIEVIASPV